MKNRILLLLMVLCCAPARAEAEAANLRVDVSRDGSRYSFSASFDTSLERCSAYRYLTDYDAARRLPGVIESRADRQSSNIVRVARTADEQILFFYVRLNSVMEYTEKPFIGISFTQLQGDSKVFQGDWTIEPKPSGSTLRFRGVWEPDTLIPLFIIDHFAKNGLLARFRAIAELAEMRKDMQANDCENPRLATAGE